MRFTHLAHCLVTWVSLCGVSLGAVSTVAAQVRDLPAPMPTVAAEVAFALFSPIATADSPSAALMRDGRRLSISFGTPFDVIEVHEAGEVVRVRGPEGETFWVNAADIVLRPAGSVVTTGSEFQVSSRPGMRIYFGHNDLAHFLARGAASAGPADLQEVHDRPSRFNLALPLMATDRTYVLGDRTAEIVEVLLPISTHLVSTWQELRGVAGPGMDVRIIVDGSDDARIFTSSVLAMLARPFEVVLEADARLHRLFLSQYSETTTYYSYGEIAPSDLRRPLTADLAGRVLTGREPAVGALTRELGTIRDEAAGTIVIMLNGGDIADLSDLNPAVLDQFQSIDALIIAQVTPEVSPSFEALSGRLQGSVPTVAVDFSASQSREIMRAVSGFIQPDEAAPLSLEDRRALCDIAHAAQMPCLLPSTDDLYGDFPYPPGGAVDTDWYSVMGWMVLDGSVFRQHEQ